MRTRRDTNAKDDKTNETKNDKKSENKNEEKLTPRGDWKAESVKTIDPEQKDAMTEKMDPQDVDLDMDAKDENAPVKQAKTEDQDISPERRTRAACLKAHSRSNSMKREPSSKAHSRCNSTKPGALLKTCSRSHSRRRSQRDPVEEESMKREQQLAEAMAPPDQDMFVQEIATVTETCLVRAALKTEICTGGRSPSKRGERCHSAPIRERSKRQQKQPTQATDPGEALLAHGTRTAAGRATPAAPFPQAPHASSAQAAAEASEEQRRGRAARASARNNSAKTSLPATVREDSKHLESVAEAMPWELGQESPLHATETEACNAQNPVPASVPIPEASSSGLAPGVPDSREKRKRVRPSRYRSPRSLDQSPQRSPFRRDSQVLVKLLSAVNTGDHGPGTSLHGTETACHGQDPATPSVQDTGTPNSCAAERIRTRKKQLSIVTRIRNEERANRRMLLPKREKRKRERKEADPSPCGQCDPSPQPEAIETTTPRRSARAEARRQLKPGRALKAIVVPKPAVSEDDEDTDSGDNRTPCRVPCQQRRYPVCGDPSQFPVQSFTCPSSNLHDTPTCALSTNPAQPNLHDSSSCALSNDPVQLSNPPTTPCSFKMPPSPQLVTRPLSMYFNGLPPLPLPHEAPLVHKAQSIPEMWTPNLPCFKSDEFEPMQQLKSLEHIKRWPDIDMPKPLDAEALILMDVCEGKDPLDGMDWEYRLVEGVPVQEALPVSDRVSDFDFAFADCDESSEDNNATVLV